MNLLIADTFTDSLAKLTAEEQKAAKTTAFDLQLDPSAPGLSYHKLDRAKDKRFWSIRVNRDIRIIVHKTAGSLLLCYVDHHDKAYDWAERRKLQTHPTTGAAQIVEVRETVQEIRVPVYVQETAPLYPSTPGPLFAGYSDQAILSYGVPPEWLNDVKATTEANYLDVAEHLPAEAAEALLELATGGKPRDPIVATADPFAHPDAQRRFRVMANVEELERALEFPWEKWTVFLHPDQREWVERDQKGPARVSGSAGTGKTIVALHRAVHLARNNSDARILLATFSQPLANALRTKLRYLIAHEPRLGERIDIGSFDAVAQRLYRAKLGQPKLATNKLVEKRIEAAAKELPDIKFALHFLVTEWQEIVDAWQLKTWEEYRNVARLGRKTRIPESQRKKLWPLYERVWRELAAENLVTEAELLGKLASATEGSSSTVYDFVVVDEAQDLSVAQMRFLAAIGGQRANALFFAGDFGQRIFQQPFSWKSLGVDVRGRSRNLRVNYRTSHQIRSQADKLLGPEIRDPDGIADKRNDTISVFNGPAPEIHSYDSEEAEISGVAEWLKRVLDEGVQAHETAIFVRSQSEIERAAKCAERSGCAYKVLDEHVDIESGHVSIGTMHLAKGLEFRAVAVMACDDEVLPLQSRIEEAADESDLKEVYDTERHLLYVACTRARDYLFLSGVLPFSEFLDDLEAPES